LFRRGALACIIPYTLPVALLLPQESQAFDWQQLWQTEDQQAERLLEQGEAAQAAEAFKNPQWRGTANYRAGEFSAAEKDFAQGTSAETLYNLANSLTQQGRYDDAIAAYNEALKQQPQLADAEHNREIAQKLKALQQQQQQEQQQQSGQDQQQQDQQGQDQKQQQSQTGENSQQQDPGDQQEQQSAQQESDGEQQEQTKEQQKQQQSGERNGEQKPGEQQSAGADESPLDPETQQALEQWLRQIPDDPAGLMREKFKYESLQRRRAYRSGEWQPPENGATQRW
jgi:Ca-activated chloride channel family protein